MPERRQGKSVRPGTERIAPVIITDVASSSKDHDPQADRNPPPRERLASLDERLGPVKIGELTISRVELYRMGAKLTDSLTGTDSSLLLQPDGALIDAIRFDPLMVEHHIKSSLSAGAPDVIVVLFELASNRSPSTPAILDASAGHAPSASMNKVNKLLNALQAMRTFESSAIASGMPTWVDRLKSRGMLTAALGMQLYGIYSGLVGIRDGLRQSDLTEVAVSSGEIGAEFTSILTEHGLLKTGQQMLRQGDRVLVGFKATTAGKSLLRGAGLMASILTLPFDIYHAINAFDAAAKSKGKEAMDHYVAAGMNVASAGLSVALGSAALAGFGSTGVAGLVACAVLILGSRIYAAARQVDDIDDYIELSVNERWRSGWFAFTGQDLDSDVMERYQVERTRVAYAKALEAQARNLLRGELEPSVEALFNGRFQVEMQPTQHWKLQWADGEQPYREVNTPQVVEGDDVIDASKGLDRAPAMTVGLPGKDKGIYWQLGGGNDQVHGVHDRPNYFSFSTGKKNLTGGYKNDVFMFHASETLKTPIANATNALHGGAGSDTLSIKGELPDFNGSHAYTGHEISLPGGLSLLRSHEDTNPVHYATITSIENVETLPRGYSRVIGNRHANTITLNGMEDSATGGDGDDLFYLMGNTSRVDGGPGKDRYYIAVKSGEVRISEDGKEPSIIELGYPMEGIKDWWVQDTSLKLTLSDDAETADSRREVFITGVYIQLENRRILRNDALLFVTHDGFTFKPDLPDELATPEDQPIDAIIVKQGMSPPAPVIFNGGTGASPDVPAERYFVPRECHHPVFIIPQQPTKPTTTLFLDYDDSELESVHAQYHVENRTISYWYWLTYRDMNLVLTFTDGTRITLKHWIKHDQGVPSNVAGILMSTGVSLVRPIVLVLRDGTSYRVGTGRFSYHDDHRNPGNREIDCRQALRRRAGRYVFSSPVEEVIRLPARPQRISLPERQHTSIYVLEGNMSTYEVHPSPGATLRLCTASMTESSIWNVHADTFDINLDRTDIFIGTTWILLGDVRLLFVPDDRKPQEIVYVNLSSGRYQLDTRSDKARLLHLNARFHADVVSVLDEIQAHEADDSLATTFLGVDGVRLIDGTPGAMFYDTLEQRWVLDRDDTREVNSADLEIDNLAAPHDDFVKTVHTDHTQPFP
ncbi:hypothetical protein J3P85_18155 [Pseudomonas sp. Z1-12]|uniref:hypothetical protein n=1 Tax=Pseudomonas sp. Z1-12 TaxID=2817408 RepID=UPI003DA9E666